MPRVAIVAGNGHVLVFVKRLAMVSWPCHTVAYERNVRVAYEIFALCVERFLICIYHFPYAL
jgi:hypothetical protein